MPVDTMAHFSFGMAATVLLVTLFWPDPPYPRSTGLLGGVWATIPSLSHGLPLVGDRLAWLPDHAISNVFWFHRVIGGVLPPDGLDRVGGHRFTAVFIASALVVIAWAEWRGYRTPGALPHAD